MWTLAVAGWYPDLQRDQQLLLSTLLVGMMCGGAFALAAQLALVCTDLALYAAKDNGRGRFEIFAPQLGDRHRRRVCVAQELSGALARAEFELAWQPQVDIGSWRATGAEVLLRWQHPTLGMVPPAEFTPVAEEAGLIAASAPGCWTGPAPAHASCPRRCPCR